MRTKDMGALFGLAALWGASFLFIRIASPAIGPFLTAQGRVTLAAAGLLLYASMMGVSTQFFQRWKQYLIIGLLNAAIPFTFVAIASLQLNASLLAIINSMTPLFTALAAGVWLQETLNWKKWFGILMGMAGVIILVGWSPLAFTVEEIAATILSLLSTVSYALAGVYAKRTFRGIPPVSIAYGQQMGAALLLVPFTLFQLPTPNSISPEAALSVAGVALFSTAAGYLLYYYLIARIGPTKTVSVTFLIPLFGMLWGVVFLNEPITKGMLVGLFVILGSIFLISDKGQHEAKKEEHS
ncbi:DMT family transporter [Paenibacillus sp. CC-CFT747]|nr:DMT family transporter [Paenibacillus sp. CC-CFT747]